MTGQIQQPVDLSNAHTLRASADFDYFITGLDLTFLQHAKIEAWPAVSNQQSRHLRFVHPYADAITGDSRLRDLEERATDAVLVTDTDLRIGQTLDREVLSELPKDEICAVEFILPVAIGIHLVNEYCAVRTAMAHQIPLRVTLDVQSPHPALARNRVLPNGCVDSLSAPSNLTWQTYIH